MEEYMEVQPGQVIIEQGQLDKGFYILESGTFEVIKDGVLLSVLKHPGTIFGEMGDFLDEPRTCTVKAKDAGKGGDDAKKKEIYGQVENDVLDSLKKLDDMEAPSGKKYSEAIPAGEIEGTKLKQ